MAAWGRSNDRPIGVWDVGTGKLIARLVGHGADVLCVAMSPDGTRVSHPAGATATCGFGTRRISRTLRSSAGTRITFIPRVESGRAGNLSPASGDSTVRIWETRTLAEQMSAANARRNPCRAWSRSLGQCAGTANDPVATTCCGHWLAAFAERCELLVHVAARFALRGDARSSTARGRGLADRVDGKIDEAAWDAAPWSEPFVRYRRGRQPKPRFQTRVRCFGMTNISISLRSSTTLTSGPRSRVATRSSFKTTTSKCSSTPMVMVAGTAKSR